MSFCQPLIAGWGLGLRSEHFSAILEDKPAIPWFEVLIDNYIGHPKACAILEKIRADYPVVFHGVGLSIGSIDELDENYLNSIKELINRFQPAWYSDHLSFSRHQGRFYPDLFPIPLTNKTLQIIAERIHKVRERLNVRFALENATSYFDFSNNEMPEAVFFRALQSATDSELLLDINNIFVNAKNRNLNANEMLSGYLGIKICQIHIAGFEESKWGLVDTHGSDISDSVIRLLKENSNRLSKIPVCLERDNNIGPLSDLINELQVSQRKINE